MILRKVLKNVDIPHKKIIGKKILIKNQSYCRLLITAISFFEINLFQLFFIRGIVLKAKSFPMSTRW